MSLPQNVSQTVSLAVSFIPENNQFTTATTAVCFDVLNVNLKPFFLDSPILASQDTRAFCYVPFLALNSHDRGFNERSDKAITSGGSERSEALDLSNGHLTDTTYIGASRWGEPVNGWFRPRSGFSADKHFHYVAKVQYLDHGQYEIMIRPVDLKALANVMDSDRSGKREKPEVQSEANVIKSKQRAKSKVRQLAKSMGVDRMLTLTRKELDPDSFCTVADWKADWDRFCRAVKRLGVDFRYIAVLERHKKGNLHLHAGFVGHIKVDYLRKIWYSIVGGRFNGEVDISYKHHLSPSKRASGAARYISKYITKGEPVTDFNQKRYWSTRHKLPPVARYILNSDDLGQAFAELCEFLDFNPVVIVPDMFVFPSGSSSGCWFATDGDCFNLPPF